MDYTVSKTGTVMIWQWSVTIWYGQQECPVLMKVLKLCQCGTEPLRTTLLPSYYYCYYMQEHSAARFSIGAADKHVSNCSMGSSTLES